MKHPSKPVFPLLGMKQGDFHHAVTFSSEALLAECTTYLELFSDNKGFKKTVHDDTTVRGYGIYEPEAASSFVAREVDYLPRLHAADLVGRVSYAAVADKPTVLERNNAKEREIGKLRDVFAHHAEKTLAVHGKNPVDEKDRFVLEYMLKGAMKNYDYKNTLEMNATQFAFDQEQKKIVKPKGRSLYGTVLGVFKRTPD